MELQEQITILETEKKKYIDMLDNLNNEKLALDQMLVDSIKQILNLKIEVLKLNKNLNDVLRKESSIEL